MAEIITPTYYQGDHREGMFIFKNIDFVGISPASTVLFTPFNGKNLIVKSARTVSRLITGTIGTQPQFKITDGTNDIVAAAANLSATQGRAKLLTIITDRVVSFTAPLTITKTVAAAGTNPVFRGDLIIDYVLF